MNRLDAIEQAWRRGKVFAFDVGDTVEVHVQIREGEKERIQKFTGTVIGRKGSGLAESFRVRRIVQGEGVERIFPVHSPRIAEIVVVRKGKARRAKLFYLRDRTGKAVKVAEDFAATGELAEAAAAAAAAAKAEPEPVAADKK